MIVSLGFEPPVHDAQNDLLYRPIGLPPLDLLARGAEYPFIPPPPFGPNGPKFTPPPHLFPTDLPPLPPYYFPASLRDNETSENLDHIRHEVSKIVQVMFPDEVTG